MKVAIVGAGFTGLAAAHELAKAGHAVCIYEAEAEAGGLAIGFKKASWKWTVEKAYHHWFATDAAVQSLVKTLGTEHKLLYKRPVTVSYFKGKFYPLDSVAALFAFPGLGWHDKIRFGLASVYLKYIADWKSLEKDTAHSWLPTHYGKRTYALIWEPLLKGKFGTNYKKVTMAWMWARIKARTPSLGTYEGGFMGLVTDWVKKLKTSGVEMRMSTPIEHIRRVNGRVEVTVKGKEERFDAVLVTLSPFLATKLIDGLPKDFATSLVELKSLGAVVLLVSLKRKLSKENYYWFNLPKGKEFPFLSLVEHTNFVNEKYFNGEHLIYCGDYVEASDPILRMSKKEVMSLYLPVLKKINPEFDESWLNEVYLFQAPYAQPIPFTGHSKKLPGIKTPLEGIYLASMSQVYPWDRGTNYAIELGQKAARVMMHD